MPDPKTTPPDLPAGRIGALAGVRFLAELGLLAALAFSGAALGQTPMWSWALAVALPAVAAAVWGRWVAPRAARRLSDPARLGVEVILFGAAAAALAGAVRGAGATVAGAVLLLAYGVSARVGRQGW